MRTIQLTQGQVAHVDDSDYQKLSLWKWQAVLKKTGFYASRNIELARDGNRRRRLRIYMHRYLMGFPDRDLYDVHHKNHQTLDNQRKNLETVSVIHHRRLRRKGGGLSSRYLGVSWWASEEKWVAQLVTAERRRYIGGFTSEFDAAIAFDMASVATNGATASRNFQVT